MKWTPMVKHFTNFIYLNQNCLLVSKNITVTVDFTTWFL